jgi:hypothetical protein
MKSYLFTAGTQWTPVMDAIGWGYDDWLPWLEPSL